MKRGAWMVWVVCAAWLGAACAQSGERAPVRTPASGEAEEAPARPIATSLANDPLNEAAQPGAAHAGAAHADEAHAHQHGAPAQYSCPMHPEVQQAGPGECPKCGMRLTLSAPSSSPQAEPTHVHAK